jgi:uncharacterized protein YkwD
MTVNLAATAVLGVAAAKPGEARAADIVTIRGCPARASPRPPPKTAAEKWMLDLRNQKRVSRKLSNFCVHPALQRAAVAHSRELSDRDYLSHDSRCGKDSRPV